MGIDLVLNRKFEGKSGIRTHLDRFNKDYARHEETGVVLHFETETTEVPVKNDARLYTYVTRRNELFRGASLVQSNVARRLPSPPVRSYSTTAMILLKRVVNGRR
mmetsp:Transcript_8578/g.12802  ORF Transcript_8578/g.12802 Transcript_8578/m.12802 type:complete len:105 (-) Transcript_8578:231-545(-)